MVGVVIGLCMFRLATLCHKPLSEHKYAGKVMQICTKCRDSIELRK